MNTTTAGEASAARILVASLVGTAIEFFDFYIYTTAAALVFGKLFFPSASVPAQQFAAYASFGIAFLARPLGSVVFGHFGDRIGRKSTLVASLLVMGLSTVAIGFLPTYDAIGWAAPFILCLLRFAQGFGLGGEWGGATLLAVENAPPGHRTRYSIFPQLGAPVGFLAANGLFLLLGLTMAPGTFESWGWRLPFLASAVLVALGLWARLRLTETPVFLETAARRELPRVPVLALLRDFPAPTLVGILALVVAYAIFYLTTAFALGYGTHSLHYDRQAFLAVELAAIVFLAAGIVVAGRWADRGRPRRVMIIGCAGTILVGFLMGPLIESGSLFLVWLFQALALFGMGLVYGPAGAWLASSFPPHVRYTGCSIAYNVGGIIGGGFAPAIAQALAGRGGLTYVGIYLAAAAVVSLAALLAARDTAVEKRA